LAKSKEFRSLELLWIFDRMSEDREVLREVWQGRVPACFNLSSEDVYTMAMPDPYYLMLPRLSYVTIVTDKVSTFIQVSKQVSNFRICHRWLANV
jgi:hypothetical protein